MRLDSRLRWNDETSVSTRVWRALAVVGACSVLGTAVVLSAESDKPRASVPPGISQDGSRPSEGAIKGGSIDAKKSDTESAANGRVETERCRDLEGTLRTQCIEDARKKDDAKRSKSP